MISDPRRWCLPVGAVALRFPKLWTETMDAHRRTVRAAILHAWHQRQITDHFQQLTELRDQPGEAGDLRDDATPDELANYCVHALAAASSLHSEAAIDRLVTVTTTCLRATTA